MMRVEVKADDIAAYIDSLKGAMPKAQALAVLRAAQVTAGIIRKQIYESFPSGRTGELARSYRETFFKADADEAVAGVYSDLVYAAIQEDGGIINPRTRKYLAVPVKGSNIALGKWPRHWGKDELTLIKKKGKNAVLATIVGGKVIPQYVLLKQVTIRPKHYLAKAAETAAAAIEESTGDALTVAIEKEPA